MSRGRWYVPASLLHSCRIVIGSLLACLLDDSSSDHQSHSQVDPEDAIVYHVDKVRRPVAEDKALNKAIAMLQARGCFSTHV